MVPPPAVRLGLLCFKAGAKAFAAGVAWEAAHPGRPLTGRRGPYLTSPPHRLAEAGDFR